MILLFKKMKNSILAIMILTALLLLFLMDQSFLSAEIHMLSFEIFFILLLGIFLLYVITPSIKILYKRKGTVIQRLFLLLVVIFLIILYWTYIHGDVRIYFSIFYLAAFLNIATIIDKNEDIVENISENVSENDIVSESTVIKSRNSLINLILVIVLGMTFFLTTIYDSETNSIMLTMLYIIIVFLTVSSITHSRESLKGDLGPKISFWLILLFAIFTIVSVSGPFIDESSSNIQYSNPDFLNQSNISFKVPNNWYVVDGINNRTNIVGYNVSEICLVSSDDMGEIWIEFWKNDDNLSVENIPEKWEVGLKSHKETINNYSHTNVSGVPAIVFNINGYGHGIYSNYHEVVFIKNDYVYAIGYWGKDLNLLEERAKQILDSFETSK